MLEHIILGIIQGITEWLPISSEGFLVLAQVWLFGGDGLVEMVSLALFLHLGTFFAALIYFRRDVAMLFKALFNYKKAGEDNKKLLKFLIISTIISGIIGGGLLVLLSYFENKIQFTGKIVMLLIGFLLLGTAILGIKAKKYGEREVKDLKRKDGILLGIVQGFAILPGFSRSGLTVGALLLKKFNDSVALRLSFLMSLPIVLGGNIILQLLDLEKINFDFNLFLGLLFAFIFGLLTIHFLLKLAKKIKFGYFVLIFGLLTIISVFV